MAILENRHSGARVVLRSETTIGRSRQCVLRLDEGRVSGHHALVRWSAGPLVRWSAGPRAAGSSAISAAATGRTSTEPWLGKPRSGSARSSGSAGPTRSGRS
ncbi:MAG: FHA domain-containing protein [Proteobacteria bacterium]|nr:FHA domain-containing protein [Pseudomonadota bacterium]